MSDRILVVSPYPPLRDGIGAYTVQQVRALRRAGHHVEVVSPVPSAAHHHLPLRGRREFRALTELASRFDRVIVHFHPDVFYTDPSTPISRLVTGRALARAFRAGPPVEIWLHEVDRRWAVTAEAIEASQHEGRLAAALLEASSKATRAIFRAAASVKVHVENHRTMMIEDFGVPADRVEVVDHGGHFTPKANGDRDASRARLGLDPDGFVFCCIGFIQPHKGFDRAVRAFTGLAERGASLHVVGSVRTDTPEAVEHHHLLEALVASTPGAHLHVGYLSDEAFDRWIVASDVIVLPYRHIWSSSVVERAQLFGRPVIASQIGGLAEQLAGSDQHVLVRDDRELAVAMARASRGDDAPVHELEPEWAIEGDDTRAAVMREVRRRAAIARGTPVPVVRGPRPSAEESPSSSAPLRRLRPLDVPPPTSARPGVSSAKRLVRRALGWEIDPIRDQVRRLHQASILTAEAQEKRLARIEDDAAGDDEVSAPRR